MNLDEFAISENETDFCFNPLTCSINGDNLVAWIQGVDESTLYLKRLSGGKSGSIEHVGDSDHIVFFEQFDSNQAILSLETTDGYKLYLISEDSIVKQHFQTTSTLIKCWSSNEDIFVGLYDYKRNLFTIATIDGWTTLTEIRTFGGVDGIPQLFLFKDYYLAGWVTAKDTLRVACGDFNGGLNAMKLFENSFDYLIGSQVDENWVVFGGYSTPDQTMKLTYCRKNIVNGINFFSQSVNSDKYKGMGLKLTSVGKGFMLLADGPDESAVHVQRFTPIGGWLYPLTEVVSNEQPTWSPELSYTPECSLLVYIRDYSTHSQVYGTLFPVGELTGA